MDLIITISNNIYLLLVFYLFEAVNLTILQLLKEKRFIMYLLQLILDLV